MQNLECFVVCIYVVKYWHSIRCVGLLAQISSERQEIKRVFYSSFALLRKTRGY